jgi:hypothetical protein
LPISEQPISQIDMCKFFLNGFINGYIGVVGNDLVTNLEPLDIDSNGAIKISTWKLGFVSGCSAADARQN